MYIPLLSPQPPIASSAVQASDTPFPQWAPEVKVAFANRDVLPILILGLKRDLRSEDDPNGIIYPQDGYRAAQAMRADKYMECSAVTGELVGLAFEDICTTAIQATRGEGQSEGGCSIM
ncbi:hypothetical protein IMZ48_05670 [Candidatus Bathyarchaeota archaeon]|nr:hypothetical protein [Candidatus Bathyarchaeota archaeon]